MNDITTLAHLSDPHLSSLHQITIGQLLSKRLLGYLSWKLNRKRNHRRDVLSALEQDLTLLHPHHIVVTGDLTQVGLPQEFQEARDWLQALGSPSDITVIPGNHDAYVQTPYEQTFALWAPYMASDAGVANGYAAGEFPSLRIRGSVALIGLSSACPTRPFLATGQLGTEQLTRLSTILRRTREQHLFRIVLIHHPPAKTTVKWRKRLTDQAALRNVLFQEGSELILHGHAHRSSFENLDSREGLIPAIGVPAASYVGEKTDRTAQYHLYRLTQTPEGWHLHISVRGYSIERKKFEEQHHRVLTIPARHSSLVTTS